MQALYIVSRESAMPEILSFLAQRIERWMGVPAIISSIESLTRMRARKPCSLMAGMNRRSLHG
ncbi:hypothetical protein KSX_65410 [Ktedonospora formicarum]|uniref:Uncharacterized protein n=1 Tax=Ktedonospora formicarum TaxID=2778364 RepID=A0A8J3I9T0_9CHLR|nr:hypothetical protein KSX_65410 [Ktedonospora formicarum]